MEEFFGAVVYQLWNLVFLREEPRPLLGEMTGKMGFEFWEELVHLEQKHIEGLFSIKNKTLDTEIIKGIRLISPEELKSPSKRVRAWELFQDFVITKRDMLAVPIERKLAPVWQAIEQKFG